MVTKDEIIAVLNKMIISASGWRGVFGQGKENVADEQSVSEHISPAHQIICGAAAYVFADFLHKQSLPAQEKKLILLGTDTRPTGKAIVEAVIPVLLSVCEVQYAGITTAPEIMAWARSKASNDVSIGFIYISASHNPIGHNGIKFGLADGGVLGAENAEKLSVQFKDFLNNDDYVSKIETLIFAQTASVINNIYNKIDDAKEEALKAYYDFCSDVVWGEKTSERQVIKNAMMEGLKKRHLGIVCDFNGSARTVSIDKKFFSVLGFNYECINDKPGQIVHRIVPEGESLLPCCALLEKTHERDASFVLGYVPDCDGDRGNLVIWDDSTAKARALEAQEVFALACIAEFSHLVWTGDLTFGKQLKKDAQIKFAVAINDPTSMRIDRIAEFFGISVFRAEVGEANVVTLARKLREEGYIVRILGEGSAGGNITHPSAVRDPINTVLAIAKMLLIGNDQSPDKKGFFNIWCKLSGQEEKYKDNFTITDILATLPQFITTPAYSEKAILNIKTEDHAILKDRYQQIFFREWEVRKDQLKKFDIYSWEAIAYNGIKETRNLERFADALRGGLKILFKNNDGKEIAYIWMRGSATEPVFRIMADVCLQRAVYLTSNADFQLERDLLEWQKKMIMEADGVSK
ncbi:MAG: phosphatidylglycerol lysyltransferase [Treponema sp.]|nr:phosphatidylglycerol lysyltransferase [Treponema sp.]MCL2252053.1 phosphatidylglycerol lysyltransferase [Treponema sp.]